MEDEVKVGVEMLDYMTDLQMASSNLTEAKAVAEKIKNLALISYRGEAEGVLQNFVVSLDSHLQRLIMFYNMAFTYIYNSYSEITRQDEVLVAWLESKLQDGNT